jgi:hypothetical protein
MHRPRNRSVHWTISRRIVELVRTAVILAGEPGPDNVAEPILAVRPAGVNSKTKKDQSGSHRKDLDSVTRFHEAARAVACDTGRARTAPRGPGWAGRSSAAGGCGRGYLRLIHALILSFFRNSLTVAGRASVFLRLRQRSHHRANLFDFCPPAPEQN